jgi:hypothetical protein
MYVAITIIILYGLYRFIRWLITRWRNGKLLREVTASREQRLSLPMGASGSGNVVNIKIKTSNKSLAMSPEAIPLQNVCPNRNDVKGSQETQLGVVIVGN